MELLSESINYLKSLGFDGDGLNYKFTDGDGLYLVSIARYKNGEIILRISIHPNGCVSPLVDVSGMIAQNIDQVKYVIENTLSWRGIKSRQTKLLVKSEDPLGK